MSTTADAPPHMFQSGNYMVLPGGDVVQIETGGCSATIEVPLWSYPCAKPMYEVEELDEEVFKKLQELPHALDVACPEDDDL